MYGFNTTAPLRTRYQVPNSTFGTHSSNKSSGMVVPPRSPDLNPLDCFLWGYIKQRVYATPSTNIAGTSKSYYGCVCQRVTWCVIQCAAGSAVPCPDVYCC
ncbi:hypothetical protein AVEN_172313-1 [Araneus ventricosus]|uniref:Uncharacterized protein n=1 Tax=Araneus ventricosus TaxID=182803 RepID=A0A4Y2E1F0_ARAVE|nr:hypothetical protein AVEN_172313-1 [Araneus ventricosus]